jgi:D-arabinose 1-dehydrogenase-like Zn-dependent alcohol dehydrogenase
VSRHSIFSQQFDQSIRYLGRDITAEIKPIRSDEINRAYGRGVNKDVRYRFVIDMTSLKRPE